MEILKYDVIIIGGGLTGLRAAAAVYHASLGRLSTAIISKVPPMRSHSIAAEGGMAAVLYPELTGDSYEQHAYDTVKGGDFLVDQDAALLLAQEAPKEIWFLEKIGVPWNRDSEGRIALRRFGGMSRPRTAFAQDKTGLHIMSKLYAYVNRLKAFDFYTDFIVTKLVIEGGEFRGVVGLDLKRGETRAFLAKAGIIATGGAGRLYKFTTNSYIVTGEMLGFAIEAGIALKDMEFVQWHPTALVPSGVLISEAARAEGAYLVNKEGGAVHVPLLRAGGARPARRGV
jgi:succinate dehydrogenase / fumarate reductase flavoprotein subunit